MAIASHPAIPVRDRERLLFGVGFAFGVMFTMLMLAVSLTAATRGEISISGLFASAVTASVMASVVFAAVVGVSLYLLSFRENQALIPLGERD